jgi:TPR repeat protein
MTTKVGAWTFELRIAESRESVRLGVSCGKMCVHFRPMTNCHEHATPHPARRMNILVFSLPLFLVACGEHTPHAAPSPAPAKSVSSTFPNEAARQLAAQSGNAEAQLQLAQHFYKGEGFAKDDQQAFTWAQRAATQGNAAAQYLLGGFYDIGCGAPEDPKLAFLWFQKAAVQGHIQAQHNLAVMYEEGYGTPASPDRAVLWFQKAAAQGHVLAQVRLGTIYAEGNYLAADTQKSAEWFQKAAQAGNDDAQSRMGVVYQYGIGVSRDLMRAYIWYTLAAAQHNMVAQINRNTVEAQLTPAQRTEGKRIAEHWKTGQAV